MSTQKPEDKIKELLLYVKREKPDSYESVKKVLKYLFKSVNEDYFDKKIALDFKKDSERESYPKKVNEARNSLFENYINCEDGVLDLFIKMCHDESKNFETFFNGIEIYLEMIEEHLYSNYKIVNYVFNIYTMLKGYEVFEGKHSLFANLVNKTAPIFIPSNIDIIGEFNSYGRSNYAFIDKKYIIDELIKLKTLTDNPVVDEMLEETLNEVNDKYQTDIQRKILKVIRDYQSLYRFVSMDERNINDKTAKQMENNLKSSLEEYKKKQQRYYSSAYDTISYFSTVVLFGNRYSYLEEKLNKVEPEMKFKKDILTRIEKWDYKFFDYLNNEMELEQDSFITCMNSVFDSDTYYELVKKMDCILEASELYESDPKKSLTLINSLNTNEHKEVIDGVMMKWPESNSINKTTKPDTIMERTIKLHSVIECSPPESFYKDTASSSYYTGDIKSFVRKITDAMNENKREKEKRLEQEAKEKEKETQKNETKKPKGLGSIFKK